MKKPNIKRVTHDVKFFLKQHKNDILFGAGVATEIGALVSTANATLRVKELSDKAAADLQLFIDQEDDDDDIRMVNANGRRTVYRKVTKGTLLNYARPAAWLAASIGCYSKSYINMKGQVTALTAALAVEHARNQELVRQINENVPMGPEKESNEESPETSNAPYSGGIPNDLDDIYLDNGVIIFDSSTGYFAENEGYANPTRIMLSPTCIEFKKDPYSDWTPNFDWNVDHIKRVMKDIVSHEIALYGFVNLNEIRSHFSAGRSYKLEEAENYYVLFDPNKHMDNQVYYRIYMNCDDTGAGIRERLYIDIFNTVVPKPGDLKSAKAAAIAANPFKEN